MNKEEAFYQELSLNVYQQVMEALTVSTFEEQFREARLTVLREVLTMLDPGNRGMVLSILQCTPPVGTNPVRSLYVQLTLGTGRWKGEITQTLFLGCESLSAQVLTTGVATSIVDTASINERRLFVQIQGARSIAAYPIKCFGRWVGVLGVGSTFPLSPSYGPLFQEAASLLGLTLSKQELYTREQMAFQLMPFPEAQHTLLTRYPQELLKVVEQGRRRGQSLSFFQARQAVLQTFEEELIRFALQKTDYSSLEEQGLSEKSS